jgi:hypothetical protein
MTAGGTNKMQSTVPTITTNGTHSEELIHLHQAATEALNKAYNAVVLAAPQSRDFPGRDNNYRLADMLHRQRTKAIYSVLQDHRVILHELLEQKAEKEKQKR